MHWLLFDWDCIFMLFREKVQELQCLSNHWEGILSEWVLFSCHKFFCPFPFSIKMLLRGFKLIKILFPCVTLLLEIRYHFILTFGIVIIELINTEYWLAASLIVYDYECLNRLVGREMMLLLRLIVNVCNYLWTVPNKFTQPWDRV